MTIYSLFQYREYEKIFSEILEEGKNNIKYIEKINQSSMTFTPEVDANQNEIIAWDRIPTIESINKLRKYLKII